MGSYYYCADNIGLHRVENSSNVETAVSLHLYCPPFDSCSIFNKAGKKTVAQVGKFVLTFQGFLNHKQLIDVVGKVLEKFYNTLNLLRIDLFCRKNFELIDSFTTCDETIFFSLKTFAKVDNRKKPDERRQRTFQQKCIKYFSLVGFFSREILILFFCFVIQIL